MPIPIQNIYYLLCYAWSRLDEGAIADVSKIKSTEIADLFARVLASGTSHLLRRGLDRGYLAKQEETSCLRGRIDFDSSLKRMLFPRGSACCLFDDLSHDVLHNQILRSTMRSLTSIKDLDAGLRRELYRLDRYLHEVKLIRLNRFVFRKLQLNRNNAFYAFLMQVCELIHNNLLVDETHGDHRFRDFLRNDGQMPALFEAFVFNFYKIEQSVFKVCSDHIDWDAESDDDEAMSYLPLMRTDISLRSIDRTIIIDTKYYEKTLQEHFGKLTVHSANLYQINAYLKNLEPRGGHDAIAEGILLYPVVSQQLDLRYRIGGHVVRVCTIDLAQDWQDIRKDLLALVA